MSTTVREGLQGSGEKASAAVIASGSYEGVDGKPGPKSTAGRAGLAAGIGLLTMAVLAGVANVGVIGPLVTEGNAAHTARDILAAEGSFRFAIAALAAVVILDVIVAWGLFEFFKGVQEGISRLAGWLRLAYSGVFAVAISELLGGLRLLTDGSGVKGFSVEQLQALALLKLNAFEDVWMLGLVLFGVHLGLVGYLAYRSGFVPRFVGAMLVIAGLGYLVDSFGRFAVPGYSFSASMFTFAGELLLGLWLVARARRVVQGATL